jgi:hypothetical protein
MPTRFPASQFVVAGHLYVDLTPSLLTEGLPRPGSLSPSGPLHVSTGGAVPNVGPALWRLGHKVTLVAQFGDDWLGKVLPASAGASGVGARSAHCGWAEHKLQHCDGSPRVRTGLSCIARARMQHSSRQTYRTEISPAGLGSTSLRITARSTRRKEIRPPHVGVLVHGQVFDRGRPAPPRSTHGARRSHCHSRRRHVDCFRCWQTLVFAINGSPIDF